MQSRNSPRAHVQGDERNSREPEVLEELFDGAEQQPNRFAQQSPSALLPGAWLSIAGCGSIRVVDCGLWIDFAARELFDGPLQQPKSPHVHRRPPPRGVRVGAGARGGGEAGALGGGRVVGRGARGAARKGGGAAAAAEKHQEQLRHARLVAADERAAAKAAEAEAEAVRIGAARRDRPDAERLRRWCGGGAAWARRRSGRRRARATTRGVGRRRSGRASRRGSASSRRRRAPSWRRPTHA